MPRERNVAIALGISLAFFELNCAATMASFIAPARMAGQAIRRDLPATISVDRAYQNAMNNSDQSAWISPTTEWFKQISGNPSFKKRASETILTATHADASQR